MNRQLFLICLFLISCGGNENTQVKNALVSDSFMNRHFFLSHVEPEVEIEKEIFEKRQSELTSGSLELDEVTTAKLIRRGEKEFVADTRFSKSSPGHCFYYRKTKDIDLTISAVDETLLESLVVDPSDEAENSSLKYLCGEKPSEALEPLTNSYLPRKEIFDGIEGSFRSFENKRIIAGSSLVLPDLLVTGIAKAREMYSKRKAVRHPKPHLATEAAESTRNELAKRKKGVANMLIALAIASVIKYEFTSSWAFEMQRAPAEKPLLLDPHSEFYNNEHAAPVLYERVNYIALELMVQGIKNAEKSFYEKASFVPCPNAREIQICKSHYEKINLKPQQQRARQPLVVPY